jgi:hypothetical protein
LVVAVDVEVGLEVLDRVAAQPRAADLLAFSDAGLGALVVGLLSVSPTADNFAALGRMVRAGSIADLEDVLRRGRRRGKGSRA